MKVVMSRYQAFTETLLLARDFTSAGPALGLASAALFGASTPLAKLLL